MKEKIKINEGDYKVDYIECYIVNVTQYLIGIEYDVKVTYAVCVVSYQISIDN